MFCFVVVVLKTEENNLVFLSYFIYKVQKTIVIITLENYLLIILMYGLFEGSQVCVKDDPEETQKRECDVLRISFLISIIRFFFFN